MTHKMLSAALLAALCPAAMTASAAAVDLYGVLDTGLTYSHVKNGDDTLEMTSGNYAGPRWGLRGSEKVSDDLTVSFILESGFADDTGAHTKKDTLFNRESQIALSGSWGKFGAGRVGAFSSGSSSLSWYWDLEPFETGYIDAGVQGTQQNVWLLHSNTFYYISPVFEGAKLGLQYGMNDRADQEEEHFSHNNSWFNAALRWDGAQARAIAAVESTIMGNATERKDQWSVKLAGAWQPAGTAWTLYAGANWYKNFRTFSDATWDGDLTDADFDDSGKALEGISGFLGVKYTMGPTDLLGMVQYLDGENKGAIEGAEKDYSRTVVSIGLHHHLSKRTMIYAIGSWANGNDLLDENATNRVMAHFGMTHFF